MTSAIFVAVAFYLHATYCYGALAGWLGRFRRLAWMRDEAVAARVGEIAAAAAACGVYAVLA